MNKTGTAVAKSVCVAYSWAKGWGLDVGFPKEPDKGDLVVEGKTVCISSAEGCKKCEVYDIRLDADVLAGRDVDAVVAEMHKLTRTVGKGEPPAFRNTTGTLRAKSDDYVAVSLRLTPFERTANPPPDLMAKYAPIVKREVDCAARRYAHLMHLMSMEKGDFVTIANCYLVLYLHRHQNLRDEKVNGGNLTKFLRQEFGRWAQVTIEHLKNITFGGSGAPLSAALGSPVVGATVREVVDEDGGVTAGYDMEFVAPEGESEPNFPTEADRARYEKRAAMQRGRFLAKKSRAAVQVLEDGLASFTHEQFVGALSHVIREERCDVEAREEAQRRFDAHAKTCEGCRVAVEAWTERELAERRQKSRANKFKKEFKPDYIPTIDEFTD